MSTEIYRDREDYWCASAANSAIAHRRPIDRSAGGRWSHGSRTAAVAGSLRRAAALAHRAHEERLALLRAADDGVEEVDEPRLHGAVRVRRPRPVAGRRGRAEDGIDARHPGARMLQDGL